MSNLNPTGVNPSTRIENNVWSQNEVVEAVGNDAEEHYSAESIQSILVCTGVYNHESHDENLKIDHGHRDMIVDPQLKKPTHTVEHVLDAVNLVFNIERYH